MSDVLDGVGFRMRDGGLGLAVEPTPEGVRVVWRGDPFALRSADFVPSAEFARESEGDHGRGLRSAMVVAVAAVLGQAGYRVRVEGSELIVTADA